MKEPIWTLKDLADHMGTTTDKIKGWAVHYPMPEHIPQTYRKNSVVFASQRAKQQVGRYKRSALLRWFKETQAAITANAKEKP